MIRRRNFLAGAAVLSVAPVAFAGEGGQSLTRGSQRRPKIETMTADRARALAAEGKLLLVDVRPSAAWSTIGVPDLAEPLDFSDPMFWDVLDVLVEGDKSVPVVLICWTGGRSLHVAEEMTKRGYARAIDVGEGIRGSKDGPGWVAKGLPMEPYAGL